MRAYWDSRARTNALWYVDTSLAYDEPDLQRFLDTGVSIVRQALDEPPPGVTVPDGGTALEIGCGLGRVLVALRHRFGRVVGVDVSPEMLERARAIVGDDPAVELVLGDGTTLAGVPDESIDVVVSFTVFQHIPDADVVAGYLREAGRVLRPGGLLAFQWNNEPGPRRWALRRRWLALLQRTRLRPERFGRHAEEFLGCRIPLSRLDAGLGRAGLRRTGLRNEGTLWAWAWAVRDPAG